jgi:hypothetical protein
LSSIEKEIPDWQELGRSNTKKRFLEGRIKDLKEQIQQEEPQQIAQRQRLEGRLKQYNTDLESVEYTKQYLLQTLVVMEEADKAEKQKPKERGGGKRKGSPNELRVTHPHPSPFLKTAETKHEPLSVPLTNLGTLASTAMLPSSSSSSSRFPASLVEQARGLTRESRLSGVVAATSGTTQEGLSAEARHQKEDQRTTESRNKDSRHRSRSESR